MAWLASSQTSLSSSFITLTFDRLASLMLSDAGCAGNGSHTMFDLKWAASSAYPIICVHVCVFITSFCPKKKYINLSLIKLFKYIIITTVYSTNWRGHFRTCQWWRWSVIRPVVNTPLQYRSVTTGVHLHCSMWMRPAEGGAAAFHVLVTSHPLTVGLQQCVWVERSPPANMFPFQHDQC